MLCVAVLYLCVHSMPRAWRTLNTDFPNYYMAARLVHEGYDTSRMYEWTWIEREKDHRGVDDRVIGLLPITPFSTLAVWPIAGLKPLTAKHVWIVFNLLLLIPMAWMLRRMTRLSYARIALVLALSFPLYRNLLYGQFYVLLLLMIVAGVLVLAARMAGRGRCAGGRGGRLQGVSGAAAGVVFAKAAVARAGGWLDCRRGVRGDFGRGVWRGGESHVAGGDSAVGDARRGPGDVCGGWGSISERAAWASAGRAAVESASVA